MPGPISDSYDPEFGSRASDIIDTLDELYTRLSIVLGNQKPMYIGDLIDADLNKPLQAVLSEKDWRLIRFCVERAKESI